MLIYQRVSVKLFQQKKRVWNQRGFKCFHWRWNQPCFSGFSITSRTICLFRTFVKHFNIHIFYSSTFNIHRFRLLSKIIMAETVGEITITLIITEPNSATSNRQTTTLLQGHSPRPPAGKDARHGKMIGLHVYLSVCIYIYCQLAYMYHMYHICIIYVSYIHVWHTYIYMYYMYIYIFIIYCV
jgi:hypothetical protein